MLLWGPKLTPTVSSPSPTSLWGVLDLPRLFHNLAIKGMTAGSGELPETQPKAKLAPFLIGLYLCQDGLLNFEFFSYQFDIFI